MSLNKTGATSQSTVQSSSPSLRRVLAQSRIGKRIPPKAKNKTISPYQNVVDATSAVAYEELSPRDIAANKGWTSSFSNVREV